MSIEGKHVFITGANRGIGAALVREALDAGASRVYAAARQPVSATDARVVHVCLDVTDPAQAAAAAAQVGDRLDILVNNAGVATYDNLAGRDALQRHLDVNLYGTYDVTQALLPALEATRGAVVNVLSIAALAALPILPAYSISKAAAFSLSQSLRALLRPRGVNVHAVLLGPVDTDMNRDLDIPKARPADVAAAIFEGVAAGKEEIFPDPMSGPIGDFWQSSAIKDMERQNAAFV